MWPYILIAGGVGALVLGARSYLKGPRCRWSGSCRVAVIGDSITAGGGYARYLERALPRYRFDTFGHVGQGTAVLLDRMLEDVVPGNYDEIIIQGGLNDISRDSQYIIDGLERMVRAAKASGARVILLSLTPWHRAPQAIREINKQLRWSAPFWGVDDFVDVWTPLADANGALRPDLIGDAAMSVHPNSRGHELMGQAIIDDAY